MDRPRAADLGLDEGLARAVDRRNFDQAPADLVELTRVLDGLDALSRHFARCAMAAAAGWGFARRRAFRGRVREDAARCAGKWWRPRA